MCKYDKIKSDIIKYIPLSQSFRELAKRVNISPGKNFNDYVRNLGEDLSHFTMSHPNSTKYKNHKGKTFGFLTIIDVISINNDIKTMWYFTCQCKCGNIKNILVTNVVKKRTISCGCAQQQSIPKGNRSSNWNGVGELSGSFFYQIKCQAKKRSIDFKLTKEYLWDLFIKQDRKCKFTGIELHFSSSSCKYNQTASLDRIDNNKPYIKGNVQWVHKNINKMRNDLTIEDFVQSCKMVADNYN